MRRVLATGTPDRLPPLHSRAGRSLERAQRRYARHVVLNWLFEPDTPEELIDDIYMHTLTLAICAAMQGAQRARVTWPQDDEIAARVMTAAAPPKGGVQ